MTMLMMMMKTVMKNIISMNKSSGNLYLFICLKKKNIINEKLVRSTIETFSENKLFKKELFISVSFI